MSDTDKNQQFREYADSFIDVANQHIEKSEGNFVSSAMLYGTARFCSFVVASTCQSVEELEQNREMAVEFYTKEFQRMLSGNLEEYKKTFAEPAKYEHLIKK